MSLKNKSGSNDLIHPPFTSSSSSPFLASRPSPGTPPARPNLKPVKAFTAKCEVCSKRNPGGMHRCKKCGWQTCHTSCVSDPRCTNEYNGRKCIHFCPIEVHERGQRSVAGKTRVKDSARAKNTSLLTAAAFQSNGAGASVRVDRFASRSEFKRRTNAKIKAVPSTANISSPGPQKSITTSTIAIPAPVPVCGSTVSTGTPRFESYNLDGKAISEDIRRGAELLMMFSHAAWNDDRRTSQENMDQDEHTSKSRRRNSPKENGDDSRSPLNSNEMEIEVEDISDSEELGREYIRNGKRAVYPSEFSSARAFRKGQSDLASAPELSTGHSARGDFLRAMEKRPQYHEPTEADEDDDDNDDDDYDDCNFASGYEDKDNIKLRLNSNRRYTKAIGKEAIGSEQADEFIDIF